MFDPKGCLVSWKKEEGGRKGGGQTISVGRRPRPYPVTLTLTQPTITIVLSLASPLPQCGPLMMILVLCGSI